MIQENEVEIIVKTKKDKDNKQVFVVCWLTTPAYDSNGEPNIHNILIMKSQYFNTNLDSHVDYWSDKGKTIIIKDGY